MASTRAANVQETEEAAEDEVTQIRFSLTALGEALLVERKGKRFRGFGPCSAASLSSTA